MESLLKQVRRKQPRSLPRVQFAGIMSQGDDSINGEFAAAVAAAAAAITSITDDGTLDKKRPVEGLQTFPTTTRTKSKKEDSTLKPKDSGSISRWLSGKETKEDRQPVDESSMKKKFEAATGQRMLEDSTAIRKIPEKGVGTVPSIKKTPTFTDKYLNETGSKRFESPKQNTAVPSSASSSITRPPAILASNGKSEGKTVGFGQTETEADAWEKAEEEKIRKRYENMNSTISEWVNEKKAKAKRRIDRKEGALEQRRAKVVQEYREEISRIDKIAGGARALADERKRKEESKTRAKAEEIRSIGKIPQKCLCF